MKIDNLKSLAALAVLGLGVLGLVGCSSEAPKTAETKTDTAPAEKKDTGPAVPVTGKTAFYEMYDAAHTWAPDIQALSLTAGSVNGVTNADGKAGVWTAVFASPSMKMTRTYVYSVAEQLPTYQKGVKAEGTDPWPGPTAAATPFAGTDVTVDSDAAYKTAADKAASWIKDNPGKTATITLGFATRFPAPVWYIMWGDAKSGYAAYVNAATGNVLTK
jgi:hypothetical protein